VNPGTHDAAILAEKIALLLTRREKTLALAESCTGGLMAHLFTTLAGSSAYFRLSAVTYANDTKERVLGVRRETLQTHGAVSEAVAREMAVGACRVGMADFGLSTTGIAGPSGGTETKPVGMVCIGLCTAQSLQSWCLIRDTGERKANQRLFAALALERLYHFMLEESS
jgi:nicotinamide-nucleotide amidase